MDRCSGNTGERRSARAGAALVFALSPLVGSRRQVELADPARGIANARKHVNQREGWTRAEDTVLARRLAESPDNGQANALARARLDTMIAAYDRLREWIKECTLPSDGP